MESRKSGMSKRHTYDSQPYSGPYGHSGSHNISQGAQGKYQNALTYQGAYSNQFTLKQSPKASHPYPTGAQSQNFMSGTLVSIRDYPTASHRTSNNHTETQHQPQPQPQPKPQTLLQQYQQSPLPNEAGIKLKTDHTPQVPSPVVERTNNTYQSVSLNNKREAPQKGLHRSHADTQHFDHFYKVILAGDAGVGKSNILLRYVKGVYDNLPSTIGVEFAYKVHVLQNQTKVKAQIWDTSGSEKYRSITTGHYRFALGAILVYDITNRESFTNCQYWVDNIRQFSDESVVIGLVGNKADVTILTGYKRKVTVQEAAEFAKQNKLIWIGETSAQKNQNVKEIFEELFESIYQVQTTLIQEGKKRPETLKISEEELALMNHRCCY